MTRRRRALRRSGDEGRGRRAGIDPDALEELLAGILEASGEGAAIVVEGERDERSLRELGVEGPIVRAARRPALEVAEDGVMGYEEVVILTDWDRAGDELARRIELHLRGMGARVDTETRERLKRMVRREIKDVESLSGFVERVRSEICPEELP